MEFYIGLALFQTYDNFERSAMMEAVMGEMLVHSARRGAQTKPELFKDGNKLGWPKPMAPWQSKKEVWATRPLRVSVIFKVYCHFYFASHSTLFKHPRCLLTHYFLLKLKIGVDSTKGPHQPAFSNAHANILPFDSFDHFGPPLFHSFIED